MTSLHKHIAARLLVLISACFLAGVVSISPGLARPDFGVRGGAYSDEGDDAFLGGEVLWNLDDGKNWFANPNVEHAFVDDGDLTSVSFDFHYDFVDNQPYTLWAGAGPTVLFRDGDAFAGQDSTDPGVNLLFGVGDLNGTVRPYGQVKVIVADDTEAALAVGVRF
jgi:hypothetical protein